MVMPGNQTELIIGLVGAAGTDLKRVEEELRVELDEYGYTISPLRLSRYLQDLPWAEPFAGRYEDERIWGAMDAGTKLREETDHDDALALWAISDIVTTRETQAVDTVTDGQETHATNLARHAWILRSLKTPAEVSTMRAIYGPRFVLIAAYSPEDQRERALAEQIRVSRGSNNQSEWAHRPAELIERDRKENLTGGQDVEGTFHQADFFIDASDPTRLREDVGRSLEILFGNPFRTPTRDEFAQFQAAGAAMRSAELSRQVGAAIATPEGSIVAIGTNEVPRAGGGSHWEEDGRGNREFEVCEVETNRREQDRIAADLADRLCMHMRQAAAAAGVDWGEKLGEQFEAGLKDVLLHGGLHDLTEFGRAVHAEMDALMDAARRGVPVRRCILHTTTFPCHNCARHVIAAGIERVVFVEPYAKSRARDLHAHEVAFEGAQHRAGGSERVKFEPFRGVAPRRYLGLFDLRAREHAGQTRKDGNGRIKRTFDKRNAVPVLADLEPAPFRPALPAYRRREILALTSFAKVSTRLTQNGSTVSADGQGAG